MHLIKPTTSSKEERMKEEEEEENLSFPNYRNQKKGNE